MAGCVVKAVAAAGWVAAVLSGEADEADEEDDSGCGWLAGWLAAKPKIRRRGTLEA